MDALIIPLGSGSAPIDVVAAFGSIWVANHHSDDVSRLDPASGDERARIDIGSGNGPGWFAITDDAIWVTRQNSLGMAKIDPVSNTLAVPAAGVLPPCGPPAVAQGAVWYFACDSGQMVRIDLATNAVTNVPADGLSEPWAVDDQLYAVGHDGIVRLEPASETFLRVGDGCCWPTGYGAGTLWLSSDDALTRVDLASGNIVGTLPLGGVTNVEVEGTTAWGAAHNSTTVSEIETDSNQVVREIPAGFSPTKVIVDAGVMWVTDYGSSTLWRIVLSE
jgi:streptogramin lyase